MAITVFDAVGKFTADTSELDRFIAKLERGLSSAEDKAAAAALANKKAQDELRKSLAAVSAEGGNTAQNMDRLAKAKKEVSLAAGAATRANAQLKDSLGVVKESTKDARAEAGLLGEAFGIHLPRHVRAFIAEMPLVNKALTGAFAATAIFFVIDALSQVPGKIREITASLAGWTEEAKKAYDAQIKLNDTFIEQSEKRQEAQIREKERGLQGLELTRQQIAGDHVLLDLQKNRIAAIGTELGVLERERDALGLHIQLENGISVSQQARFAAEKLAITDREGRIKELTRQIDALTEHQTKQNDAREKAEQTLKDHETQLGHQALDEFIKIQAAKIDAKKRGVNAQIEIGVAAARLEIAQTRITAFEEAEIAREAADAHYHADRQAAEALLADKKKDSTKFAAEIIDLNQKIEDLDAEHHARELNALANFLKLQQRIIDENAANLKKEFEKGAFEIPLPKQIDLDPATALLQRANQLLAQLGDETATLAIKAGDARVAYNALALAMAELGRSSGAQSLVLLKADVEDFRNELANLSDQELRGLLVLLNAERDSTDAAGDSTAALARKIDLVTVALQRQNVPLGRNLQLSKQWFDFWHGPGKSTGDVARQAFLQLADGIRQSVAAAVTGADSFGHAMQQMLASILGAIAGEAVVQALREIAKGFSDLADPFWAWHAPTHFIAAAKWGAVAAIAGTGAALVSPRSGSSEGTGFTEAPQAAEGAGQAPPTGPVRNVHRFAMGGVVSAPTLAIIGDSIRGGAQREAVIPLEDGRSMEAITNAIMERLPGGSGTVIHVHVDGMISPDNLSKVIRQIDRQVKQNDVHLTSSTSLRVTRRS